MTAREAPRLHRTLLARIYDGPIVRESAGNIGTEAEETGR